MEKEFQNKLNILRAKYSDQQSLEDIYQFELDYSRLVEEKGFLSNPLFISLSKELEKKLNEMNALLMNDENLDEKQRNKIISERKAFRHLLNTIGIEYRDNALLALEEIVDSKLS